MKTETKTVYEEFYRAHDFSEWLTGSGSTNGQGNLSISSVTAKILDSSGQDQSSSMLSNVQAYNQTQVLYRLKGGTSGGLYTLTLQIVDSSGQKFEDSLQIRIF